MLKDNPKVSEVFDKIKLTNSGGNSLIIQSVTENLKETYAKRYTKPETDSECIEELARIFNELIGGLTDEIKEGIGEYYRILSNRGLPAFEWMLEAFHVTAKKEDHKRNFPYVVGMIRGWLKYGFGYIPSDEEEDVATYFEEVTGTKISAKARLLLQNLMAIYGAIKVTRMIAQLEKDADISHLIVLILKHMLEEKFPEKKMHTY